MRPFPRSRPTRRTAVCAALALLAAVAIQIQQPAQADAAPFEVLPADPVATFSEFKNLPADSTQQVTITGNPNFTKALEVTVPDGPQSPGLDGEYEITLGVPAAATVTAGDALVATLWARAIEPTPGSTTGNAHVVFETDGSPYKKSLNAALLYGSEWQKFEFPFRGDVRRPRVERGLAYGGQRADRPVPQRQSRRLRRRPVG